MYTSAYVYTCNSVYIYSVYIFFVSAYKSLYVMYNLVKYDAYVLI